MASINPLANARAWSATYPLQNPRLAATIIALSCLLDVARHSIVSY